MNQRGDWTDWSLTGIACGFMGAFFVLGFQAYVYLKQGSWVALSVIDGLLYLYRKNPPPWLLYPDDWVGVHKLLESTPLALGLVILGVFWAVALGYLVFQLEEYQGRKQREAEERSKQQDDLR